MGPFSSGHSFVLFGYSRWGFGPVFVEENMCACQLILGSQRNALVLNERAAITDGRKATLYSARRFALSSLVKYQPSKEVRSF